jgi:hypothetical protein
MLIDMPQSLETRIANFLHKLKGQIALREALQGAGELPFLENTVKLGLVPDTNIIFDFNSEFFCSHGSNLVKKYY